MARPKKTIEKDMLWEVGKYFLNRLNAGEDGFLKNPIDSSYVAKKQLKYILWDNSYYRKNPAAEMKAMNGWMCYHVTPTGVKKMWSAMRQKKLHRKRTKQQITVDASAHDQLTAYAKRYNLTLSNAIKRLVENDSG